MQGLFCNQFPRPRRGRYTFSLLPIFTSIKRQNRWLRETRDLTIADCAPRDVESRFE